MNLFLKSSWFNASIFFKVIKSFVSLATRVGKISELGRNIRFTANNPVLILVFLKSYRISLHSIIFLSLRDSIVFSIDIFSNLNAFWEFKLSMIIFSSLANESNSFSSFVK